MNYIWLKIFIEIKNNKEIRRNMVEYNLFSKFRIWIWIWIENMEKIWIWKIIENNQQTINQSWNLKNFSFLHIYYAKLISNVYFMLLSLDNIVFGMPKNGNFTVIIITECMNIFCILCFLFFINFYQYRIIFSYLSVYEYSQIIIMAKIIIRENMKNGKKWKMLVVRKHSPWRICVCGV